MEQNTTTSKTVLDPVCGMEIDPKKYPFSATFKGEPYHFCSEACQNQFKGHERGFLDKSHGKKKGWWGRYLEKLKKQEGEVRSCCH